MLTSFGIPNLPESWIMLEERGDRFCVCFGLFIFTFKTSPLATCAVCGDVVRHRRGFVAHVVIINNQHLY